MKIEYFILSKQKIILQIKRSKEDKINIDNKEKLLKSFTELYKRSPKGEEMYNNINIGQIWRNIKNCKSNLYEDILSKNKILKAAYDTFTKGKEETKNKIILSIDEKSKLLLQYVENKKHVPPTREKYKDFNVGTFWQSIKNGYNKEIYENILSKNKILKTCYEKFITVNVVRRDKNQKK